MRDRLGVSIVVDRSRPGAVEYHEPSRPVIERGDRREAPCGVGANIVTIALISHSISRGAWLERRAVVTISASAVVAVRRRRRHAVF